MNQAKLLCKWDYVPVGRVVGLNKEYLDLDQRIQTKHKTKSQISSLQSNPHSANKLFIIWPILFLFFLLASFFHGGDWLMSVIRNRLHVAMGVISHRWQKTSKCGKNISDTLCCALHDTSCSCHILTSSVSYFRREN